MQFADQHIVLARQLRDAGLAWRPNVGHYVYDETKLIEAPSPFQRGVYFILDLKHFLRRAGSVEELKQRMIWLPQWHQARRIACDLGISDLAQFDRIRSQKAFESGDELLAIYRIILEALVRGAKGRNDVLNS